MDKDWSSINKQMQVLLNKKDTFEKGIETLIELRTQVFQQVTQIWSHYPEQAFYQQPFAKDEGYHSKTLNYSLWHIFRIEDIVAHELICQDEQILFQKDYIEKIHTPMITTGNELKDEQLVAFSKQLDRKALYDYAKDVLESSNQILRSLTYSDLKRKFDESFKQRLRDSQCISEAPQAVWLIDYWCDKDLKGLLKMPFSRHHIMHVEAMRRIKNQLCLIAKKSIDPLAYCGLNCADCSFTKWCGGCRSAYHPCSYATCFENLQCPNVLCCQEKGLQGCDQCLNLLECEKGFYHKGNPQASVVKAQALYHQKHGKKALLQLLKNRVDQNQDLARKDTLEIVKIWEENEDIGLEMG